MKTSFPHTIKSFFDGVFGCMETAIDNCRFDATQRELLCATIEPFRQRTAANPIVNPVIFLYLIPRAWNCPLGRQAEHLGAFCLFYMLALDLFDDVQDEDLSGKPYEEIGPAIAINNAITLIFLALDELCRAMEFETHPRRGLTYLQVLNRVALLTGSGQHRDLLAKDSGKTAAEVLDMQQAKTLSLALVMECAAIFAACSEDTMAGYRRIGEQFVLILQIVDDIKDIYGKSVSPDLVARKITYPLACFLEIADCAQIARYNALDKSQPAALKEVRKLFYQSGAIGKAAETIEQLRVGIHYDLAAMGNASAAHRNLLFVVDSLAGTIYTPPALSRSRFIYYPEGDWYNRVQRMARDFTEDVKAFAPPPIPPLLPYYLPLWMYIPQMKTIFYPDVEGQPEEILPFVANLMQTDDLAYARALTEKQIPAVLAHEYFHYWRDISGAISKDAWYEEWVANRLATAYVKAYHPALIADFIMLGELKLHPGAISEQGQEILQRFFAADCQPADGTAGYVVSIEEAALIQLAMIIRLCEKDEPLHELIRELL